MKEQYDYLTMMLQWYLYIGGWCELQAYTGIELM